MTNIIIPNKKDIRMIEDHIRANSLIGNLMILEMGSSDISFCENNLLYFWGDYYKINDNIKNRLLDLIKESLDHDLLSDGWVNYNEYLSKVISYYEGRM